MGKKENKGGIVTNRQIEEDNRVKGKASEKAQTYLGSQDTGDKKIRHLGNEVQRRDGLPEGEDCQE